MLYSKIFFIAFLIKEKERKREGGHGVWEEERRKEEWVEYLCEIRRKVFLRLSTLGFFYNFIHTCTFVMD